MQAADNGLHHESAEAIAGKQAMMQVMERSDQIKPQNSGGHESN